MTIKKEDIRALVQAQIVLPDYSADPFVRRRVGLALARSCGACTDEENGPTGLFRPLVAGLNDAVA
jgi:hypothetical protein